MSDEIQSEYDKVADILKQREKEWSSTAGSVSDIVRLLLFQKDQEIERLKKLVDTYRAENCALRCAASRYL